MTENRIEKLAAFVQADGREIMHSFWATLQYLSPYLRLLVEIQHTNYIIPYYTILYPDLKSELICAI